MTAISFLDFIYLVKPEKGIWIHSLPMKIRPLHHHCHWKEKLYLMQSDLPHCLELSEKQLLQAPNVDAIILDGAAIVHPGIVRTFQDYADTVFGSYILSQLQNAKRVDIVYMKDSLTTREKRGKGIRRRVASTTVLPSK